MNLDLPFPESDPAVLDAYLDQIDRELDTLFMEAVGGEIERLRLERSEQQRRPQPQDDAA